MQPHRLLPLLLLQRRLAELLKHVLGGLDRGWSCRLFHQLRPRLGVVQDNALQGGGETGARVYNSAGLEWMKLQHEAGNPRFQVTLVDLEPFLGKWLQK